MSTQKITPHLWFDKEALAAAEFHTSVFPDSKIISKTVLKGTPSGDSDVLVFEIMGLPFMSISAGPMFKINPSISFIIITYSVEETDALWANLSAGGEVLMEINKYPFSDRYGWCNDKYGVSWQVMMVGKKSIPDRVIPTIMFTQDKVGKAEEAANYYTSVFPNSKVDYTMRHENSNLVAHSGFLLNGQAFAAFDAPGEHKFTFNEAISFSVSCDTQEEIDFYWSKLSAVPESEMCGWCKDKYGVSWQIVPSNLQEIMESKDEAKVKRVTEAFMKMKKFDKAEMERAAEGK